MAMTPGQEKALANARARLAKARPDYYRAPDAAAYEAANEETGFGERLAEGAVRGLKERSLGVMQTLNEITGNRLIDPQALEEQAALYRAEGKGSGAAGFVGEMAFDPLNLLALSPAGAAAKGGLKAAQMAQVGAGGGALAGVLSPTAEGESRLTNAGVGAGLGAAAGPVIGKAAEAIASRVGPKAAQLIADESGAIGVPDGGGKLTRAQTLVYRELVERLGYTPEQAGDLIRRAGTGDVPLTLPEMVDDPALLAFQKRLTQNPGAAGEVMKGFNEPRFKQAIPQAFDNFVKSNISRVASPEAAGRKGQQAAQGIVTRAMQKRSDAAKPFYEISYGQTIGEDTLAGLMKNPRIAREVKAVRADPDFAQLIGDLPDNSVGVLDTVKKRLDDLIESAARTGENARAKALQATKSELVTALDEASPAYRAARQAFAKRSPQVERIQNSIAGAIAELQGGDTAKAAGMLFKGTPAEIRYARKLIRTSDPDAWDALAAAAFQGQASKSTSAQTLFTGFTKSAAVEGRWKAMLGPQQAKAFDRFFGALERANRVKIGSDTQMNAEAAQVLADGLQTMQERAAAEIARGRGGPIDRATDLIFSGFDWARNTIRNNQYEELARIFTGQGGEELATKLAKVKPGTPQEYIIIGEHLARMAGTQSARRSGVAGAEAVDAGDGMLSGGERPPAPTRITVRPDADKARRQQEILQRVRERMKAAPTAPGPQSSLPDDIRADEGVRLASYMDTTGNRTVGIGFNMDSGIARRVWNKAKIPTPFNDVYAGAATISPAEAEALGRSSFEIAEADAMSLYGDLRAIAAPRREALLNLSYQLGKTRLSEFERFNSAVRNERWSDAARYLLQSKYAKQTPQRAREVARKLLREA